MVVVKWYRRSARRLGLTLTLTPILSLQHLLRGPEPPTRTLTFNPNPSPPDLTLTPVVTLTLGGKKREERELPVRLFFLSDMLLLCRSTTRQGLGGG